VAPLDAVQDETTPGAPAHGLGIGSSRLNGHILPADDPRIKGTLRAIEERLLIDDEFVLRYEPDNSSDGLPPGEGAFLACSF
jgi:GH15 family glucan-1,4-alpha-glucosidase